jgi:probable HAF family extracellular repeat protein
MNQSINRYLASSLLLAINAACIVIPASSAQARMAYNVTDLGVLPGKNSSVAAAINSHGQVAGTSSVGNLDGDVAFRYDHKPNAVLERLGQDKHGPSRGLGINDFGVVVGDSTYSTRDEVVRRAAIFSNGTIIDLGTLPGAGSYSRANSINNAGQVVGVGARALDTEKSRAFVWSKATGMRDLGTLGGPYAEALAINDAGAITGGSQLAEDDDAVHAFLYQLNSRVPGLMRDLGTLGGEYSYGTAVNPKSHVVGYSTISDVDERIHAFLHDGFVMRDLGSIVGQTPGIRDIIDDQSVALGVNVRDVVVGYSYLASTQPGKTQGQQVAFVYDQGVMSDLNKLLSPVAQRNYLLYSASAINDSGQITATAFMRATRQFHAVLLTPIVTR